MKRARQVPCPSRGAGPVPLQAAPRAARSGRGGPALGGDGRVSALAGGASGCAIGARWRGRWAAAAGSVPLRAVPQAAQPGRGGPALGSGGRAGAVAGGSPAPGEMDRAVAGGTDDSHQRAVSSSSCFTLSLIASITPIRADPKLLRSTATTPKPKLAKSSSKESSASTRFLNRQVQL